MSKRIGPRMRQAVNVLTLMEGASKADLARVVGPRGSLFYGYQTVNRAIKAGLIRAEQDPDHRGRYRLYVAR